MLNMNKIIKVSTLSGLRKSINPERGLTQGDKISPLLRNIFYDALLCKLDETEGYKFSNQLQICKLAFADDLAIMADSVEKIKVQISIVTSYLDMFHLRINASKSILLTNCTKEEVSVLKTIKITTDNIALTDIRCKTDITRVLGVFLTTDGDSHQTIDHAIKQVSNIIKIIQYKHTPGPLVVYLINIVLIPILAYRLQVTPIAPTKLKEINTMFRKITKAKYNFSYASNLSLFDQELGIGLQDIQSILDQRQITNALLHQRNTGALGNIHRYTVQLMTATLGLPEDIMVCPVITEKRPNPFILHASNILFHYDLQFRTLPQNESDKILLRLTPDSYQEYHGILTNLNITKLENITKA